jgi:hypothetical protein
MVVVTQMSIRTYSEVIAFPTFEERFEYLRLDGEIGKETFGFDRIFNQMFYNSREWKMTRDHVIVRDHGCDLAAIDHEIHGQKIIIHHLNPISLEDIERKSEILLDPEFLITTIHSTHNAIHYGDKSLLVTTPIERSKNDTCPWRH